MTTDFIREVDEDLRQDRLRRLFRRFWPVLIGLAALILLAVAAWQIYDRVRTGRANASGGRYLDALDLARDGKADEATAALSALARDGEGGYRLLARLRLAAETGLKDAPAGVRLFDEVAADAAVDPAIRNVARLRAALLMLGTVPYPELKPRLDPLVDANSPVRNPAREMLALAALRANQVDDARRALDAIQADSTATGQLRQRAAALQALLHGARSADPVGVAPSAGSPALPPMPTGGVEAPAAMSPPAPGAPAAP